MRKVRRASTGIPGLDDVLGGGGLPEGRLYLLQGRPGVGKTTIAMSFLRAGAAAGERCLYITLSETEEELRAVAESHGWSFDGVNVFELKTSDSAPDPSQEYTLFNPAEVELNETMGTLLAEVARLRPTRVVFDSLSEIRLLAQSSLRYRRQVLALKHYFAGSACTVLLLDDQTTENGDVQLQSLAHGVIELEQRAPAYGTERRRVRVVKLRGEKFRGGYHDYRIVTGELIVYPRLVAAEHRSNVKDDCVRSGNAGLDALLGGGLPRGGSALLMGPPGTGKSAIAVQFALAAAERGEKTAAFLFDEAIATVHARAKSMRVPLGGYVEKGLITLHQVDPAEKTPGELVHDVRQAVAGGARIIVIDSLNGYLNAMPDENFLVVQLHELLSYLALCGVTTILVTAQNGLLGTNMLSPVDVSYLADSVILLRYFEADGAVHNALSIVKKRTGAHERTLRAFTVGEGGIEVGRALADFSGVLTGTPTYRGDGGVLMKDADATGSV